MDIQKCLKSAYFSGFLRFLPLALFASLADAALLWGIRSFMDILNGKSAFSLWQWLAIMVILSALRLLFLYWKTRSSEAFLYKTSVHTTKWFLATLRNLSPRLFHGHEGNTQVETAFEATQVLQNNGIVFFQAIQAILQLAIFLPVLLYISWPLTLFLFIIIVPLVAWMQRKLHRMGSEEEGLLSSRSKFRADLNQARRLYQNWSGTWELNEISSQLNQDVQNLGERNFKANLRKNGLSQAMETISVLSMVLVLAFCALLIHSQWMDGTGLVLFCSAVLLCYKPVKECSRILPLFRSAKSAYNMILKFAELPRRKTTFSQNDSENVSAKDDRSSNHAALDFILENTGFHYERTEHPVFSQFNLKLSRNKPVLLRGKNGIGKSTLLRLMAGLEEWESGKGYTLSKDHTGVFFMAQDLELPPRQLLHQSLARHSSGPLTRFMEKAQVKPLLAKEGLSGGQRAKVCLTWALASESAAILLDEPFAAVALADREPLLQEFLNAASSLNKWVLIASHDLLAPALESQFNIVSLDHE